MCPGGQEVGSQRVPVARLARCAALRTNVIGNPPSRRSPSMPPEMELVGSLMIGGAGNLPVTNAR